MTEVFGYRIDGCASYLLPCCTFMPNRRNAIGQDALIKVDGLCHPGAKIKILFFSQIVG